ncbi:MAG: UbiD family decarboxylase, partial [Thermofilum sp.]
MRNPSISLDVRSLVEHLERLNMLKRPARTYRLEFEVAAAVKKVQPTAILMKTEKGLVLSNLLARRSTLYEVMGAADDREAYQLLLSAMNSPLKLAPAEPMGLLSLGDDLFKMPIPKLFEKDGGHYITAGVFLSRDPEKPVF